MRTRSFSVVIANVNGLPIIGECVAALERQDGDYTAEIIVANSCRDGSADHLREHHPDVVLLDYPERRGIPELRAHGIARATGDVVCIIEDHCLVRPDWFQQIDRHLTDDVTAVGGPVENACVDRLVDHAVYLTEYADTMMPVPAGPAPGIAGNNAAYRREALQQVDPELMATSWEYFVQRALAEQGARYKLVPEMALDHKKSFTFGYFLSQRFHYSRSFAGMRRRELSPAKRLVYGLASPALAPLMLYRIAKQVRAKGRYEREFRRSLPLLVPFMLSYAVGEGVGYLFGGGESILHVE